jgi:hypothetical protein
MPPSLTLAADERMSDYDADELLRLMQQPSLAAATEFIARMPTVQLKGAARALGAAASSTRNRRLAAQWLADQASWAAKYRSLYDAFKPECFKSGLALQLRT